MNHVEIRDRFFEFRNNELSEHEHLEMEIHLVNCSNCADYFEQSNKMATLIFSSPAPVNSEFFVTRVLARLESHSQRHWAWRWGVFPLAVISLFLMVGVPRTDELQLSTNLLLTVRSSEDSKGLSYNSTDDLYIDTFLDESMEAL